MKYVHRIEYSVDGKSWCVGPCLKKGRLVQAIIDMQSFDFCYRYIRIICLKKTTSKKS